MDTELQEGRRMSKNRRSRKGLRSLIRCTDITAEAGRQSFYEPFRVPHLLRAQPRICQRKDTFVLPDNSAYYARVAGIINMDDRSNNRREEKPVTRL